MKWRLIGVSLALLWNPAISAATEGPAGDAAAAEVPALVVVVSVDQLAYEYLERFRTGFATPQQEESHGCSATSSVASSRGCS